MGEDADMPKPHTPLLKSSDAEIEDGRSLSAVLTALARAIRMEAGGLSDGYSPVTNDLVSVWLSDENLRTEVHNRMTECVRIQDGAAHHIVLHWGRTSALPRFKSKPIDSRISGGHLESDGVDVVPRRPRNARTRNSPDATPSSRPVSPVLVRPSPAAIRTPHHRAGDHAGHQTTPSPAAYTHPRPAVSGGAGTRHGDRSRWRTTGHANAGHA